MISSKEKRTRAEVIKSLGTFKPEDTLRERIQKILYQEIYYSDESYVLDGVMGRSSAAIEIEKYFIEEIKKIRIEK